MENIKFFLNESYGNYSFKDASNIQMCILGNFLGSDVYRPLSFIKWASENTLDSACGNLTALEKENGHILLTDIYSEEKNPTILKMTHEQFVQILMDWEEKVLKIKPKEVIIKYENNQFIMETKN